MTPEETGMELTLHHCYMVLAQKTERSSDR